MSKKDIARIVLVLGLVVGSFLAGTAIAAKSAGKGIVLSSVSDVAWTPLMKDKPLPALSPIEGDPMKGQWLGYLKLPAGMVSPPHSHTGDYWAVLVQGKMTHWAAEGGSEADAKQLNVGDLTFMPGKLDHISKCFPGTDCIAVMFQKSKVDSVPGKAPKAAPAK